MNPELVTVKKWYGWLWLSPLVTIPTILFIAQLEPGYEIYCSDSDNFCDYKLANLVGLLIGLLVSALWHLILLIPAFNQQSGFVRWHGRQALLLAGIRTFIPIAFVGYLLARGDDVEPILLWSIPLLIAVWFFGTMWGEKQAMRGECALARWTGHSTGSPPPTIEEKPPVKSVQAPIVDEQPEHLTAYYRGLGLSRSGATDAAVKVFLRLLVSDAMPEIKARVADELKVIHDSYGDLTADVLVAILRFSHDPKQRREALAELEQMELVEGL